MGLWSRIMLFFRVKTSAAMDRVEDPRQIYEYAYNQQQEQLRKVRQGLIDVATAKNQLQQQAAGLRARVPQLDDQAKRAIAAEREDLARMALQKKQTALNELEGLDRQGAEVAEQERKLTAAQQQLAARVDEFRTRRTAAGARYTAAEAQVRVLESLTGMSSELAELSMALGRAEEKTERMQARATALDALIESGTLALPMGTMDPVESELRKLAASRAVDEELAALKAQVSHSQLTAGPSVIDVTPKTPAS